MCVRVMCLFMCRHADINRCGGFLAFLFFSSMLYIWQFFRCIIPVNCKKTPWNQNRRTFHPSGRYVKLFFSVYCTRWCYLPCLLRQRQSDASPVFELRWVVDTGSCKLRAARHAGQTGLGERHNWINYNTQSIRCSLVWLNVEDAKFIFIVFHSSLWVFFSRMTYCRHAPNCISPTVHAHKRLG